MRASSGSLRGRLLPVLVGAVLALVACTGTASGRPVRPSRPSYSPPQVRHVFVINLENKGYAETFGPGSKAPYLAKTLRRKGALLTQYYGIAHHSLPNYLAQISGQGPNPQTQGDCPLYSRFHRTGTVAPGQAVGGGCVYPSSVRTLGDQLVGHGLTWRGYMQDMGRGCRHPRLGSRDHTERARVGDQYATKHNPFMYFRSITAHHRSCARRDVGLAHLPRDLRHVRTTRNLSYITPNLCNDGHDSPCVDGRPGGLRSANTWLRRWVPRILRSAAFKRNGLLVVTFDEAEGSASACCGEGPGPNSPMPGIEGPGGGRVGAVVISPFVRPGTRSRTPYNHYSLLRTIEDYFGLGHLGYAKRARHFGADVYGAAG